MDQAAEMITGMYEVVDEFDKSWPRLPLTRTIGLPVVVMRTLLVGTALPELTAGALLPVCEEVRRKRQLLPQCPAALGAPSPRR